VTSGDVLSRDLRAAVSHGQLTAVYQPQFDLEDGRMVSVEALCRWEHPEHGMLRPDAFIDLAEREGLMSDLGRSMLDIAGAQVKRWRDAGNEVELAVNASPSEIVAGFAEHLVERVAELGFPRGGLTVEITESPPLTLLPAVLEALTLLHASGIQVSIDDFGTGHTSLALLDRLPLGEVKIDKSLIQVASDRTDAQVDAAVALAKVRGWRVVAEGIETTEHLDRARALGCDRAQGYLLGMPMTAGEIDALFDEGARIRV
jgi:EAL domain-containing protein (putative c-di-GMP-specific phosphodiesterase class I)